MPKPEVPDLQRLFGGDDRRDSATRDSAPRFVGNWLTFRHGRPIGGRKPWLFVAAIAALLALSGALTLSTALLR